MNVLEKVLEELEKRVNSRKKLVRYEKKMGTITDVARNQGALEELVVIANIIDSCVNKVNDDWIPCSKQLPEQERWVFATVMHSAWVSDYDSKWVKEEEKNHHQKSFGTYLAHMNTLGKWIFLDEGGEITCDKEIGNNLGIAYSVVIAWQPLPEPYRAADDSKPDWKENMLNTFLAGH